MRRKHTSRTLLIGNQTDYYNAEQRHFGIDYLSPVKYLNSRKI